MRNACVVCGRVAYDSVIGAFEKNGYTFSELRVFYEDGEVRLKTAISELKSAFDNLVVVVDSVALSQNRNALTAYYKENPQSGVDGSCIFADKEKTLFLLSSEGGEFITSACVPYLQRKYGQRCEKLTVRLMGAGERHVQNVLDTVRQMDKGGELTIRRLREYDEEIIDLYYGEKTPKMLVDDVMRMFADAFADTVYAMDDTPLNEQLVRLLKLRGRKLSVAESFTGGGIAKAITSVSGASAVYFEGLNTYDERSKIKRLGVSEYVLNTMGAVSEQTAYEMAAGLIATGDCDLSIATTGLAGPKSDRSMLPVGLCFIAVGTRERVFVYRYKFDGSREEITQKAIRYAMFLAYKHLKKE